jgi:hypothetical protein
MQKKYQLIGIIYLLASFSSCFAQQYRLADKVQKSLDQFYTAARRQSIILSFHQPEYMPGDTVFFHGFIVNPLTHQLEKGKKITTLKLIGPENKTYLINKFLFEAGQCANQFVLPEDLKPNIYKLIAFTDDMADDAHLSSFLYQSHFTVGSEKVLTLEPLPTLDCFAEGGSLVAGVMNKLVAVSGLKNVSAQLITRQGLTVAVDTTDSFGYASFHFIPQANTEYLVRVRDLEKVIYVDRTTGVSLAIEEQRKGFVDVLLQAAGADYLAQDAYLVLSRFNRIYFSTNINLKSEGQLKISIPTADESGLFRLTLFSASQTVIAERLIGIEPRPVEINVTFDKDSFNTRELVQAFISVRGREKFPLEASLAVSVYKSDLFLPEILKNARGANRLPGNLNAMLLPEFFFKIPGKTQNNFLIANLNNVISWPDIFTDVNPSSGAIVTRKEGSFYFRGKAIYTATSQPVADSSFVTFYLSKNDFTYGVYTRPNGSFTFPYFKDFGDEEIFYSIESNGKILPAARIEIDEVTTNATWEAPTEQMRDDPYVNFQRQQRRVKKSYTYYHPSILQEARPEYEDEWIGDYTIDLSKFEPFLSMQEVLTNVVPSVQYKQREERIRVFLKHTSAFASANPIYIVDGVMTNSTSYFLSLNPAKVSKITIFRSAEKLNRFGVLGKNGIIIIESKSPQPAKIPRSERTIFIKGRNRGVPFHLPDYTQNTITTYPDLRCSLYSNSLFTDGQASVKFFTGDATGTFDMMIEGFTKDGSLFSRQGHFKVFYKRRDN